MGITNCSNALCFSKHLINASYIHIVFTFTENIGSNILHKQQDGIYLCKLKASDKAVYCPQS